MTSIDYKLNEIVHVLKTKGFKVSTSDGALSLLIIEKDGTKVAVDREAFLDRPINYAVSFVEREFALFARQ